MKRDQTEVDLRHLKLADAILIASDLQFMTVLTKLKLKSRYNFLGDEGRKALRDAAEGREGFELFI